MTQPKLDLSTHGLQNTELVTRIFEHLFEKQLPADQAHLWQTIAEYNAVKRDIRTVDFIVQELRDRGEPDEVIYRKVIDRLHGRNTH